MKETCKNMLILFSVFILGFIICRWTTNPVVETYTETITKYDTIIRTIPNNIYHYKERIIIDTIIRPEYVPYDVDTLSIISQYLSRYIYHREWSDSLLYVSIRDTITQNRIYSGDLKYKILRPQTVINNTTEVKNYKSYLYLGADVPIGKYDMTEVNILWANKKFYLGAGYSPLYEKPYWTAKAGFKIIGW